MRAQAGGGALHAIPPAVLDNIDEQVDMALRGQFGSLPWPGLLRKLGRGTRLPRSSKNARQHSPWFLTQRTGDRRAPRWAVGRAVNEERLSVESPDRANRSRGERSLDTGSARLCDLDAGTGVHFFLKRWTSASKIWSARRLRTETTDNSRRVAHGDVGTSC